MVRYSAIALCVALTAGQAGAREANFTAEGRQFIALAAEACARYFLKRASPAWLEASGFQPAGKNAWSVRVRNKGTLGRQSITAHVARTGDCSVSTSHSGFAEGDALGRIVLDRVRAAGFREVQGKRINTSLVEVQLVAGDVRLDYEGWLSNTYAYLSLKRAE